MVHSIRETKLQALRIGGKVVAHGRHDQRIAPQKRKVIRDVAGAAASAFCLSLILTGRKLNGTIAL